MSDPVIDEFRANDGIVGGFFEGSNILLLHTVGAKSGEERTTPVMWFADGDRMLIVASKGGADTAPAWYHNLKASSKAKVEVRVGERVETLDVDAEDLPLEERDRLYAGVVAERPQFGDYEKKTTRKIPLIALSRA